MCLVQRLDGERAKWAGEQKRKGKGKGDKGAKADAERARARELAEAEEAVARCCPCLWHSPALSARP